MDQRGIASFLILDRRFPRSLAFCYAELSSNLAYLAREYGFETEAHAIQRSSQERLAGLTIEAIFEQGLHQFIGEFLACNYRLAQQIQRDYRFVE